MEANLGSGSRPGREGGMQFHMLMKPGDMPRYTLLPGDPGRVPTIGSFWDEYHDIMSNREYRAARGLYKGLDISACSTGMGGPSTEMAVVELANLGVDTFIRVGTCGALQKEVEPGDIIISSGAVRLTGAPQAYVGDEYPAVASYDVVLALIEACERLGLRYHVGITATVDSFYAGEAKPAFGGYMSLGREKRVEEFSAAKIMNFEMEAATLFVLANLFGLRSGTVCAAGSNRITDKRWDTGDVIGNACRAASEAVAILTEWDKLKEAKGAKHFYPSLLKG